MNRATPDVFICHAADTLAIARALQQALGPALRVFVPEDDLLPGDAWDEIVPARLGEAPLVVVIVSPGWLVDHWARDTLVDAIRRCQDDPARRVVPVYTGGATPDQALGLRRLKGHQLDTDDVAPLVAELRRVLPTVVQPDADANQATLAASPIRPALVVIPDGRFQMGSPEEEFGRRSDEGPQRAVAITRPFYMAATPVTRAQYAGLHGRPVPPDPAHPVVDVSWFDAVGFCNRLSHAEGRAAAYLLDGDRIVPNWQADGYRLPTEAEWEYACRAGSGGWFWTDGPPEQLARSAWLRSNSGGVCPAVGGKPCNPFGLHDMHGTIWEWCHDWYGPYDGAPVSDPCGPATGHERVLRGGSFRADALACRSAARLAWKPRTGLNDASFRVVRRTA